MQNCIKLFSLVSSAILGNLSKLVDMGCYESPYGTPGMFR